VRDEDGIYVFFGMLACDMFALFLLGHGELGGYATSFIPVVNGKYRVLVL
jgi:hypothetical protein